MSEKRFRVLSFTIKKRTENKIELKQLRVYEPFEKLSLKIGCCSEAEKIARALTLKSEPFTFRLGCAFMRSGLPLRIINKELHTQYRRIFPFFFFACTFRNLKKLKSSSLHVHKLMFL